MDIEEKVGTWKGPTTPYKYVATKLDQIMLIHDQDCRELRHQYGQDKLPVL